MKLSTFVQIKILDLCLGALQQTLFIVANFFTERWRWFLLTHDTRHFLGFTRRIDSFLTV